MKRMLEMANRDTGYICGEGNFKIHVDQSAHLGWGLSQWGWRLKSGRDDLFRPFFRACGIRCWWLCSVSSRGETVSFWCILSDWIQIRSGWDGFSRSSKWWIRWRCWIRIWWLGAFSRLLTNRHVLGPMGTLAIQATVRGVPAAKVNCFFEARGTPLLAFRVSQLFFKFLQESGL